MIRVLSHQDNLQSFIIQSVFICGLAFDAGGACATMAGQTIAAINILQGEHE
jgi:hypothetical protein